MAEDFPDSCKEMIKGIAQSSLTIYASERHNYQSQGLVMVEETLAGIQKKLQDAISDFQGKVDSEDGAKSERVAAAEKAQSDLTALQEKLKASADTLESSETDLASVQAKLATITADFEDKEKALVKLTKTKEKLEEVMASAYEPLKLSGAKGHDGRKQLSGLEHVLKDIGLEIGLVEKVPESMKKAPEARGTFDRLVQKHVEAGTANFFAKTEEGIKAAEVARPQLEEAKTAAQDAIGAAKERVTQSSDEHVASEAAYKKFEDTVKAAQKAVTNFSKEFASAGKGLEAAKKELSEFVDGPLKAFSELKVYAPLPPAPEEPASAAEDGAPSPSRPAAE
jgi:chromosome segregation ATPase